jgi:hypothetical protein
MIRPTNTVCCMQLMSHIIACNAVMPLLPACIQVMSEMLAAHVLSHYDTFLEGVNTIATFERELQASYCNNWLHLCRSMRQSNATTSAPWAPHPLSLARPT